MKQKFRALAAIGLALLILAGIWLCGPAPEARAADGEPAAQTLTAREDGNPARVLAKSRKKKNSTPTPQQKDTATPEQELPTPSPVPEGPIIDPQSIADYLFSHDMELPENFLTKQEARDLGWNSSRNYVSDVAPGMSIGGDYFGNYEELLPVVRGRKYYEADCYYTEGKRNAFRVIYSNDGHVWYTEDHYQTFTELFPSTPVMTSAP